MIRKSKIVLLSSEMASQGGIQSYMRSLTDALAVLEEQGKIENHTTISLNDNSLALKMLGEVTQSNKAWGATGSKLRYVLKSLFGLPAHDIVIVGLLAIAPVALAMRLFGRSDKYFVILHGIEAWKRLNWLQRLALKRAERLIVTTKYTALKCAELNDIPVELFVELPLCALDKPEPIPDTMPLRGEFNVLCVARQDASERYKGIDHLLEAMSLIQLSHPEIHLHVVGSGTDHERLRNFAEVKRVLDQVTFHGSLSDQDLEMAFRTCDLFALPSAREGFGIVYLEAMRAGKPVIAANSCGAPYVVEDGVTGFLVEYGDIAGLAEKIILLSNDSKLCSDLGDAAKRSYWQKFTPVAFRNTLYRILEIAQ